jgi:hypothetical protein
MLVSCLVYTSTLKMGAPCSSKTSFEFHQTTRDHSLEERILHNHCWVNLKSSNTVIFPSG